MNWHLEVGTVARSRGEPVGERCVMKPSYIDVLIDIVAVGLRNALAERAAVERCRGLLGNRWGVVYIYMCVFSNRKFPPISSRRRKIAGIDRFRIHSASRTPRQRTAWRGGSFGSLEYGLRFPGFWPTASAPGKLARSYVQGRSLLSRANSVRRLDRICLRDAGETPESTTSLRPRPPVVRRDFRCSPRS